MLRMPPNGDPYLGEVVATLNAELFRREPVVLGWRHDGTNLHLRFRAAMGALWVQVHIQSTDDGGPAYDPAASVSSTEVDCRAERVQDVTVPDIPDERYYVFLIPVQYDQAGVKVMFDGEDGRPDNMAFIDIGV